MNPNQIINSPALPVDEGIVRSAKEFSDVLTLDLTDEEIKQAFQIITKLKNKWHKRFVYKFGDMSLYSSVSQAAEEAAKMVDAFEHELHETLAEQMDLLAVVDMSPVFDHGGAPVIELLGALPSHSSAKYGLDHEKKEKEVKEATKLGEAFRGEKSTVNVAKKRDASIKAHKAKLSSDN